MGHVFTTLRALAHAGVLFGAALIGFAVEDVGLVPTILGMGVIDVAAAVGMGLNPALHRMDAARQP